MFVQLFVGALLIALTVVFQAFALDLLFAKLHWLDRIFDKNVKRLKHSLILAIIVLLVFLILVVQTCFWAVLYVYIDVVPDLETALYFSISTFTTVGWGDVVLDKDWRVLSSIESINGFLMFGWCTAFIFEVVTYLRRKAQS